MKITNELNLPGPIVTAVSENNYDPGESDITVTSLIDSPQIRQLKQKHDDELVEDASMRIWSLFGSAIHKILDGLPEDRIATKRLHLECSIEVDGKQHTYILGGLLDRCVALEVSPNSFVIQDYKTATTWEHIFGLKPDRERQLNLYKLLAEEVLGLNIVKLESVMLFKDWTPGQIDRNKDYPKRPVHTYDIPIWDKQTTLNYVEERLLLHFHQAPHCTAEERWEKQGTFRLMPKDAGPTTRALRVTKTREEMESYLEWCETSKPAVIKKQPIITETSAVQVRCKNNSIGYSYCPVSNFCPQWEALQRESINSHGSME
jgi:hypothetical protein